MAFVVAGLVLVGAIGLLNLLLITAVIRRLRRQEEERGETLRSGPRPGEELPEFSAVALSGRSVSRAGLAGGPAVLVFLSTGCPACPAAVPRLVEYAAQAGLDRERTIVVITGAESEAGELIEPLAGVATVVTEPFPGELSRTFSVSGTPTTVIVGMDGRVAYAEAGTSPLIAPAAA
ncbi:TlpA family protein disulfide reductase [Streptomyces katsurahamanus]|uniref:TlpA family protein disulfide reductase n=1 Tax=Streptomyces katsurahamanus TaxID=2577098 RepID=A0ABW9NSC6_9ACTN|nr:TlpA disulfide reductase family protein [Streptomyces katsurahamanus]MQS36056.1 TlpA family protein disulfide reductase [Streptomyces katsurahamanus]